MPAFWRLRRRAPDAEYYMHIQAHVSLAFSIISRTVRFLRPSAVRAEADAISRYPSAADVRLLLLSRRGGRLKYCTCTYSRIVHT